MIIAIIVLGISCFALYSYLIVYEFVTGVKTVVDVLWLVFYFVTLAAIATLLIYIFIKIKKGKKKHDTL